MTSALDMERAYSYFGAL